MDGAGGVRGDELEVHPKALVAIGMPVGAAGSQDGVHNRSLGGGGQANVEEAWPCDLRHINHVRLGEFLGEELR